MTESSGVTRIDATTISIPRFPVAPEQSGGGHPSVGSVDVFTVGAAQVGVWELGVGVMYDIEIDEAFVVLSGVATMDVLDRSGLVIETIDLAAGMLCRLASGTRTRWNVVRTLRKVYVI